MLTVETYLEALDYDGPVEPTVETLRELHKRHLVAFPYDSSLNTARGTSLWAEVDIDVDAVFDEIVVGGRGGVCYELNGLFRVLLQHLGFDAGVLAAGIRQVDDSFGPDLEHVFNYAKLDGRLWLVDVGFVGPSYLEPLPVVPHQITHQYGNRFRIVLRDGYHVVQRRGQAGGWQAVYRFKPRPRELSEWLAPSEDLDAFARQLMGAGTVVRGRAFETGQRILIGKRLLTVDGGHDTVRGVIGADDHAAVLADILRTGDTGDTGDRRDRGDRGGTAGTGGAVPTAATAGTRETER
ncbi:MULTISPECIES: arylamine N-acetyltransferase family protein [unclassified Streptomyces]|uniref:arylamine N-acetyltransferase family protein n=1 Tax=unclassified Streptomyces TaxID=2593676 RepID=UPI0009A0E6BF|nr:arylamine N-acetyltransferase [Streptomyces sp. CB02058]